jgi:hypothetical protein
MPGKFRLGNDLVFCCAKANDIPNKIDASHGLRLRGNPHSSYFLDTGGAGGARLHCGGCICSGRRAFLVGGSSESLQVSGDVLLGDPALDSWQPILAAAKSERKCTRSVSRTDDAT